MALTTFAGVQAFFNDFIKKHNINIGPPHNAFWQQTGNADQDYKLFVTGDVPGGSQTADPNGHAVPILKMGDGDHSNVIYALRGTKGSYWDKTDPNAWFGQMPYNGPYFTDDQIDELRDWINNDCPK